ncbi:hypothetical protein BGZ50_008741 [Haplosporangium sp. Z 11]|nr:hypothetical protein BGZ50_008741 [Haplosporangium sp. Z 11]
MNKHLQQPASLGNPPTGTHENAEVAFSRPKRHTGHGPNTQSVFKNNPLEQNQQQNSASSEADAKKQQHHGAIKKTSGAHPQKVDR